MIPESLIDEIQSRVEIADIIGRYVPLKRAGRHWKALCPFHKEKTPSFVVNTDKQIFHCFGCGVGGNVFSFLMQHDRLTFPEAVQQIGEQLGVRVDGDAGEVGRERREPLLALLEQVAQYFERTLAHPEQGAAARAYVAQRGVSEAARKAFRLGFAPAGWERLVTAATGRGISLDQLAAAGLVVQGRSSPYDRFRQRLIFPITDVRGRVVGFGGRSLDGQEPKYLNSPETAVYSKGRQLFGLAQAKEALDAAKVAVVVEGYFDCVVLASTGLTHVVSPLGTALTHEQARLLKRYVDEVVLAFDADAAGEAATLRGLDLLLEAGFTVRVADLPSGQDPDECIRRDGLARFRERLEASRSMFEFLLQLAAQRHPLTTAEQRVEAAQWVLGTVAKVPNAMLRREYARELAQRFQLDERAVDEELRRAMGRAPGGAGLEMARRPHSAASGAERLLAALVVEEPSRWEQVRGRLSVEHVTDPTLRRILAMTAEALAAGRPPTAAQLASRLSAQGLASIVGELMALAQTVAAKTAAFEECVKRLRAHARKVMQEQLQAQLHEAQARHDESTIRRLLTAYQGQLKGGDA